MTHDDDDLFGELVFEDTREAANKDIVTLALASHGEPTPRSLRVSETGDERTAVLLPLSQITVRETGKTVGLVGKTKWPLVEIDMPNWLANDRGLV